MKIAHIITDEKFPDSAYDQFETVAPGCSTFFIPLRKGKLKYIKKIKPIFVSKIAFLSPFFIRVLLKNDLLILHGLTQFNIFLVSQLSRYKKRPLMIWIGMGYDYYDLIFSDGSELTLEKTKKLAESFSMNENKPLTKSIKNIVKKHIKNCLGINKSKTDILKYIDYFAPVLPSEYPVVKNSNVCEAFPKYLRWHYGVSAALLDKIEAPYIDRSSRNILLGNSASFTNNHKELFDLILPYKDSFDKIICPLSYGNSKYRDYISKYGSHLFGGQFMPLIDFVPLDQYLKILGSCPIVIMNHTRQQAGGNVVAMLHMGATIFLRKENPLYNFYSSQGVKIFTLDELIRAPELLSYRLTDDEISENRKVLKQNFGTSSALINTKDLIGLSN